LQAGTIAGTEHSVQYIPLSHTARSMDVVVSFIISCFSLLFLLLCSHLSVCVRIHIYLSFRPFMLSPIAPFLSRLFQVPH